MPGQPAAPTDVIRSAILDVVEQRGAELVNHYYRDKPFAGSLFDDLGDNPPDRFTTDDLLAASLLDVRFKPEAVRALVTEGVADDLLSGVPIDLPLWKANYDAVLGEQSAAGQLWLRVRAIPGIGRTRASKLLARKRPHLLPIIDSVVSGALGLGNAGSWSALQTALEDAQVRSAIDGMAPAMDAPAPTTLRLLDVATWMRFSESDNARDVRRSLGLPVKPRKALKAGS